MEEEGRGKDKKGEGAVGPEEMGRPRRKRRRRRTEGRGQS